MERLLRLVEASKPSREINRMADKLMGKWLVFVDAIICGNNGKWEHSEQPKHLGSGAEEHSTHTLKAVSAVAPLCWSSAQTVLSF